MWAPLQLSGEFLPRDVLVVFACLSARRRLFPRNDGERKKTEVDRHEEVVVTAVAKAEKKELIFASFPSPPRPSI